MSVSTIGDGMRLVTLPLLTLGLTDDARQVAAVAFAGQLPWLLVGLLSGVLADRFDRRRILCLVDATRAVVMAALVAATMVHALSIPLLAGVGFLLGCGQTLYNGAWSGLVPSIVPRDKLAMANARLQVGALLAGSMLGAPVGAGLFKIEPWLPLAVDALSFVFSSTVILTVRGTGRTRPESDTPVRRSLRREALEGLGWLWRDTLLRRLCVVASALNLVMVGLLSILVLYARQALGLGSSGYALLVSAFAVGGLAGVPMVRLLDARVGSLRTLRLGALATCLLCGCLGSAGSGPLAVASITGAGAANLVWNVTLVSLRQTRVPNELLGRVTMVSQMATVSAGALGPPLVGLVYDGVGPRAPFAAGTAVLLIACVFLWRGGTDAPPQPATAAGSPTAHGTADTQAVVTHTAAAAADGSVTAAHPAATAVHTPEATVNTLGTPTDAPSSAAQIPARETADDSATTGGPGPAGLRRRRPTVTD